MSVRNIMLILAVIVITGGTGFVARTWIDSQRPQVVAAAPQPVGVEAAYVLVAEQDLPAGTFIKENHLTWQAWPDDKLHAKYRIKGTHHKKRLIGAVVRRGIAAGEPITAGRVLKFGDRGFLAAVLRPGYRAVAIRINATSSIAGLVFPGDRIDIILTHKIKRGGRERRASETVLANVRVLAIDQKVNDSEGGPRVGKNATLEVTPKQAEMLAVVSELGRLSLSLRSLAKDEAELNRLANSAEPLAEPDPTRGTTHTWDTEVSRLLWRPSARQDVVQVLRGNAVKSVAVKKTKDKAEKKDE